MKERHSFVTFADGWRWFWRAIMPLSDVRAFWGFFTAYALFDLVAHLGAALIRVFFAVLSQAFR